MATEFQPYVGPRPYEEKEKALFFGRECEARDLLSLVIAHNVVLVYSQSGAGKTSLLNARLIPLLKENKFEVFPIARVRGMSTQTIKNEDIENIYIFSTLINWNEGKHELKRLAQMSLTEFLKDQEHTIDNFDLPLPRAIIFDQFEEFFSLHQDHWKDRAGFFEQINSALEADPLLRIVFVIREDYIAQLNPYAPLLPEKLRTQFHIERLRREAALLAVTEPLKSTDRTFAEGVAEDLVDELLKVRVEIAPGEIKEILGEFVEAVQLQVVCQNMWRELPEDVMEITQHHLKTFGDVETALSRFYDEAIQIAADKAHIDEQRLRTWCEEVLITSGGTRGTVYRAPEFTGGIPNAAIDVLESRHLIMAEWRAGARWYELTHDRLIEPILSSNKSYFFKTTGFQEREEASRRGSLSLTKAEQAWGAGRYHEALKFYKEALVIYENLGDSWGMQTTLANMGFIWSKIENYEEAIEKYRKAIEINPNSVYAYKYKLDLADALDRKAQLVARPTIEYFLSKAKELVANAENSFKSKSYEESIDLWNKALEQYDKVVKLAEEKKEKEIVDRISNVKDTIHENIFKAEMAIDNQIMLRFVYTGNNAVEEANKHFEAHRFDQAKESYEEAAKAFKKGLLLAENRGFANDKAKIDEALNSVEASIEAALLSKGDAMLREAKENYIKNNFVRAEEGFSSALKYFTELKIERKNDLDKMIASGVEGLMKAKLEQGKERMHEAEKLFNSNKYYEAKEGYKAARNYLEGITEEAARYKIKKIVEELNTLIQMCSQNIAATTTALMEVGGVEPELKIVDRISFIPVTPAAGKLMEKYAELGYIGGGGFADVYKAKKKNGTLVAVKVPRNIDEKTEDIFFRESHIWERLNHRNIVKLIGTYLKPVIHIEMEYVDGTSLYEILKSKSFETEKACRIAFDIAAGLEYSHNRHIIHGDINPRNVLINSIGEAKITDFGLSKIATMSSEVRGYTIPYASVEMLQQRIATEKSDIYQFGLVFYVMLTGSNPFDVGSRYETEERIIKFIPEPPSKYNSEISGLDNLIMHCLSKNSTERPTLSEVLEVIYEFMKRNYNTSLHLTADVGKIITIACEHAMMAAKNEDLAECMRALNYAKGKVRDPQMRKEIQNLIEELEFRAENNITLGQFLDKMEIFIKRIEMHE